MPPSDASRARCSSLHMYSTEPWNFFVLRVQHDSRSKPCEKHFRKTLRYRMLPLRVLRAGTGVWVAQGQAHAVRSGGPQAQT